MSDAGELSSLTEESTSLTKEHFPEPVLDICAMDEELFAVTGDRDGGRTWRIRRMANGAWSSQATVPTKGDQLTALDCGGEKITLLTSRRMVDVGKNKQSDVALVDELNRGFVSSVFGTAGDLFLGIDAGEWGGGLRRIDRQTGVFKTIERNNSGDLCGGPLNTACDPVNGIVSEPWKTDCVVVAIGLVHFSPHGRIVEVCGNKVERLYYKAYGDQPPLGRSKSDEPFSTVAFFGLIRSGDELWAAGIDGVYHFDQSGQTTTTPLPIFKNIDGINVSFALPHLVLVLTDVNQRASISGSVPMLVAR